MLLNPHGLRQYLRPRPESPTLAGWVVFAVFVALLYTGTTSFMAPHAVAVDLPRAVQTNLENPPSVFGVLTSRGVIYRNRLMTTNGFLEAIKTVKEKDVLLLALPSQTPVENLLPILQQATKLGFNQVAFSVRP